MVSFFGEKLGGTRKEYLSNQLNVSSKTWKLTVDDIKRTGTVTLINEGERVQMTKRWKCDEEKDIIYFN